MNNLISISTLTCYDCDDYVKKKPYTNYNPIPYSLKFTFTCSVSKGTLKQDEFVISL